MFLDSGIHIKFCLNSYCVIFTFISCIFDLNEKYCVKWLEAKGCFFVLSNRWNSGPFVFVPATKLGPICVLKTWDFLYHVTFYKRIISVHFLRLSKRQMWRKLLHFCKKSQKASGKNIYETYIEIWKFNQLHLIEGIPTMLKISIMFHLFQQLIWQMPVSSQ